MIVVKVFSLFFTALNSTTKPRCRGCTTGFFCPGDGTEERCGGGSSTEFSFGSAANCSACPEGWVGGIRLCYGRGGSGRRMMRARVSVSSEEWVGEMSYCLELLDKITAG